MPPVNGANTGQHVDPVFFVNVFNRIGPGKPARHSKLHVLAGIEAGPAAAAEGLLRMVLAGIS
jgi:hypothetical protein